MTLDTVFTLYPEIVVLLVATWTYVGGAFTTQQRGQWCWIALGGLAVAAWQLYRQADPTMVGGVALSGSVIVDALMVLSRWAALAMGAIFVLASMRPAARGQTGEVIGSLLMIVAGLMLVAGAADLVLLFAGLELISIPTYVLLYLGRRGVRGGESVVKYFFLSILSSAVMLYGFSFLYGLSGSTKLVEIHQALAAVSGGELAPLASVALVLVLAGLAFKLAVVPFHFYAPDVYQGTSSINAGLLAVAPKIAGVVTLVRLLSAMPGLESVALAILTAMALLTMTLGNVIALWQQNVRRMLAYSSIAHAGYLLIGFIVALQDGNAARASSGMAASLFYLCVYALDSAGAFAALAYLSRGDREVETLDDLAGLGRTNSGVAALLAVLLFSLAGIPPMIGFWGKLALFTGPLDVYLANSSSAVVETQRTAPWFLALAVVGVLNAAVAAGYYLRIIAAMYFRPVVETREPGGGFGALVAAAICAVAVILGGAMPGAGLDLARRAGGNALSVFATPQEPIFEEQMSTNQGGIAPVALKAP